MRWLWAAALAAAALAAAAHVNSLRGEFVFDDRLAIVENGDVLGRTPLLALLRHNFWGEPMDAPWAQHLSFRPLTVLSFRLNHAWHGLDVGGFHAANVALHAAVAALVPAAAWALARSRFVAAAAGLLFAVHPVHAEAVASLVGRAEVLAGLFFLLALLGHVRAAAAAAAGRALAWQLASLAAVALGVLSKEQSITVAAVCLLYDLCIVAGWAPLAAAPGAGRGAARGADGDAVPDAATTDDDNDDGNDGGDDDTAAAAAANARATGAKAPAPGAAQHRRGGARPAKSVWPALVRRQAILWAGVAVIMALRLSLNTQHIDLDEKTNPGNHVKPWLMRVLTKNLYVAYHAGLLLLPRTLCCDWSGQSIATVSSLLDSRLLYIVALYAALAAAALYAARPGRASAALALGIMGASFLPASGLFMEVGFVLAERVLYLPSLGFCLGLALALRRVRPRGARWSLLAALVLLYTARTAMRNEDWASELTLYRSGVEAAPSNQKMHHNYAYHAKDAVKEHHYREAIRLYPPYVSAYINLGAHLYRERRYSEAVQQYELALEMHHKYPVFSTDEAVIHRNYGVALLDMGQRSSARTHFEACLRLKPEHEYCKKMVGQLASATDSSSSDQPAAPEKKPKKNKAAAPADPPPSTRSPPADDFAQQVPHVDAGELAGLSRPALVMFYAPWCSHCVALKPAMAEVARRARSSSVAVVAVDCAQHESLCRTENIEGYPTVLLYRSGQTPLTYDGDRSPDDLRRFLREHALGGEAKKAKKAKKDKDGTVAALDAAGLAAAAAGTSGTPHFLMFFAPWCSHCTETKPAFAAAATELRGRANLATVDCTVHGAACQEHKIEEYPTLRLYDGRGSSPEGWQGERDVRSLVGAVDEFLARLRPAA